VPRLMRDPRGRRRDEAFFCTDRTVSVAFIPTAYAGRRGLEVTIHDCQQALGFEQPRNQTERAVRRTAPFAGLVDALVVLWAAQQVAAGGGLLARAVPRRPWYRHKTTLPFANLLTVLRQAGVAHPASGPPRLPAPACPARRPPKFHAVAPLQVRSGKGANPEAIDRCWGS
jgi:hypothetical protein